MSKKASTALYELIHAMTKSEKRYFKIYASRHTIGEQNNYITLFDFIESMEVYDESLVFEAFEGEAFLNKFPITKTRLYDSIIRSLCAFYSNSSVDAQLYRMLHASEILFKKGLYNQAKKQLKSAEKLANKSERYILLLEINKFKKKLVETNDYCDITPDDIHENLMHDQGAYEQLDYYNKLWELNSLLMQRIHKKGKIRSEEEKAYYDSLMDRLALLNTPKQPTLESRFLRNQMLSAYSHATLLRGDAYLFHEKNLRLLKSNPKKIQEQPDLYFQTLSQLIHLDIESESYASALELLKNLKDFPQKYKISSNQDFETKMFYTTVNTELFLLLKQGDYKPAIDLVEEVKDGIEAKDLMLTPMQTANLMFKVSVSYFGDGAFSESLKWINKLLAEPNLDQTEDITSFTQLLSLIVHFELGNYDLLPYAERNTQRFLKNNNRNFMVERIVLKFIRQAAKVDHIFDLDALYEKLAEDLNELLVDSYEAVAIEYFDFLGWAEAKVKKCGFAKIQKEKYLSAVAE